MKDRRTPRSLAPFEVVIAFDAPRTTQRSALERLVHDVYAKHHGADVTSFFPVLIGMSRNGVPIGAIGARPAVHSLFLENYLDEPVDFSVGKALGKRVDRRDIYEVGNLAAKRPGTGLHLVSGLASWLHARRVPWVVFTATQLLRCGLRKAGVELWELAPASKARAPGEGSGWGQYYETCPHVCVASIEQVGDAVRLGPRSKSLHPAWDAVAAIGSQEQAS